MVLFHSRASNHQRLHPQLVGGSTCSLCSRTSFQGYSGLHFEFVQGAPVRNREKVGEQFTPISLWFLVSIYWHILTMVYKPTNITGGAPPCIESAYSTVYFCRCSTWNIEFGTQNLLVGCLLIQLIVIVQLIHWSIFMILWVGAPLQFPIPLLANAFSRISLGRKLTI